MGRLPTLAAAARPCKKPYERQEGESSKGNALETTPPQPGELELRFAREVWLRVGRLARGVCEMHCGGWPRASLDLGEVDSGTEKKRVVSSIREEPRWEDRLWNEAGVGRSLVSRKDIRCPFHYIESVDRPLANSECDTFGTINSFPSDVLFLNRP